MRKIQWTEKIVKLDHIIYIFPSFPYVLDIFIYCQRWICNILFYQMGNRIVGGETYNPMYLCYDHLLDLYLFSDLL